MKASISKKKLGASRLCGWYNPDLQSRTQAEADRLTTVTGIQHHLYEKKDDKAKKA